MKEFVYKRVFSGTVLHIKFLFSITEHHNSVMTKSFIYNKYTHMDFKEEK